MSKFRKEVSSGGVLYRVRKGTLEVALILRLTPEGKKIWCLPKGKVEKGETLVQTAVREVREETGMKGEIVKKLGSINYWFYSPKDNFKVYKTVHFYLMNYISGNPKDHNWEVQDVKWHKVEDVLNYLNYDSERDIARKAGKILNKISEGAKK